MSDQEFLHCLPVEYVALVETHKMRAKEDAQLQYHAAGIITASVLNLFRDENDEPLKATDFIPGYEEPEDEGLPVEIALQRAQFFAMVHNAQIEHMEKFGDGN